MLAVLIVIIGTADCMHSCIRIGRFYIYIFNSGIPNLLVKRGGYVAAHERADGVRNDDSLHTMAGNGGRGRICMELRLFTDMSFGWETEV